MAEQDYYEEEDVREPTRLREGILLKELVNDKCTEFMLDSSKGLDECHEKESDLRVDTCYEFEDFEPYINLDCVRIDPNDDNPNSAPFDTLRMKMINVTDDTCVQKLVKQEGTGEVVPKNAVVYVHYSAYLEMEEVPFDTTYLRSHKPNRFQLGTFSVYSGFEISVSTMKKGEKSQFLIHPNYAFGQMGAPPRIPPNSTILLEIELINFVNCGKVVEMKTMTEDDKKKYVEASKAAKAYHALGNDYFSHKNIPAAIENYKKAENLLLGCYLSNDEEEAEQKKLLLKLYLNMCICYNDQKMRMPEKVCLMAKEAMFVTPKLAKSNAKLQYNWGKALLMLNDFEKASSHFKTALSIEPNNPEICEQLKILEEKKKKYYEHEKISYKKALGLCVKKKKEDKPVEKPDDPGNEFEDEIRQLLEDFSLNPTNRIQLPAGLTTEEKQLCKQLASEMKLSYQEKIVGGNLTVSISK